MTHRAMDCREAVELLQDFLKQELTAERAAAVRAHLDRCTHCEGHACWERAFLAALRTAGRRECCPEALRAELLRRLRAGD
jgi:anti-sigma factor (TIGR02949 family)